MLLGFSVRVRVWLGIGLASEVSKCFIYRLLLDHRKLLLNVNCGVKIVYDMYVASHH